MPASSSSERVSAHGHRTGTQDEGGGAAAHRRGTQLRAATQRPARIHITLGYDIRRAEGSTPEKCKKDWPVP